MPLHVVVTGAGGFVGGFVARWLAAHGFNVTAIRRRPRASSSGSPPPRGLTWQQADLLDPNALPSRFDALLHCAAETPERCPDRDALYRRNVDMARHSFERALHAGARSAVFLSSMSSYGTISVPVVTEDTPAVDLDPYGRAKREAEELLATCVARGLTSGLAIRLPGTVGKGSHDNFLSVALGRILAGEQVSARNPEARFNNIVYVGDLAVFLAAWVAAPRPGYTVTNLGATEPLPMREVIELLFTNSGREKRLMFQPGGKAPFLISLDRALSLGYRPSTVRASVESFVRDAIS